MSCISSCNRKLVIQSVAHIRVNFFLSSPFLTRTTSWRIFRPTGWLMKQNKPLQTVTADVHPLHGRSLMHNGARAETRRKGFSECLLGTDISILPYFNLRVFSWSKLHFEAPRFWEAIEDIRVKDEWPHWWPTPNLIVGEKIDEERCWCWCWWWWWWSIKLA